MTRPDDMSQNVTLGDTLAPTPHRSRPSTASLNVRLSGAAAPLRIVSS